MSREPDFLFYVRDGAPEGWADTLDVLAEEAAGDRSGSEGRLIRRITSFAVEFGLSGNLWQQWLTYVIMMHENPFSLACERRETLQKSTLMDLATVDFSLFRELFRCSFRGRKALAALTDFEPPYAEITETAAGRQISELSERLAHADDAEIFGWLAAERYASCGTGIYGLYRAFRIAEQDGALNLVPVTEDADVTFDELVGYEAQKKTLIDNTRAFVRGAHANNVLLYGDSGTGKSTSVHALMHEFWGDGLRLVELSKQDRHLLPQVLSEVKKRNYRFIIFLDDLSFEENESDYKELKAMLEGALETRADRVLIYATSNRRHLIRETWKDRSDMEFENDIHRSDTMEEKLSLASRFGVMIYYAKPVAAEYLHIVRTLADRYGIEPGDEALEDMARKWELRHGGMSGRTARQFITWLQSEASNDDNEQ